MTPGTLQVSYLAVFAHNQAHGSWDPSMTRRYRIMRGLLWLEIYKCCLIFSSSTNDQAGLFPWQTMHPPITVNPTLIIAFGYISMANYTIFMLLPFLCFTHTARRICTSLWHVFSFNLHNITALINVARDISTFKQNNL